MFRVLKEDGSGEGWKFENLPTIIASVLAAFVSIRNFLTCTFTPLDVLFPAFLCELFSEFSFLNFDSLNRLWQSAELLCLSAIGSFEHDDDIIEAWLEDVVDIVGLVMCSVDGYDIEIVTLSLYFEPCRFFRSNEGIDVTLVWFVLKPSKFVVEFNEGKSDRWFLLPRWIRKVRFSSSSWLLFPPLPFFSFMLFMWQKMEIHFKYFIISIASNCFSVWIFVSYVNFDFLFSLDSNVKKRTRNFVFYYHAISHIIAEVGGERMAENWIY